MLKPSQYTQHQRHHQLQIVCSLRVPVEFTDLSRQLIGGTSKHNRDEFSFQKDVE
jgi:hypothetical protein